MKDERREVTVIERGNPLVLALLGEHAPLTVVVVLVVACHAAVEVVNTQLRDPLGAYAEWAANPHNGNHRLPGAWFFAAFGLWLYPATLALAVLAAKRVAAEGTNARRLGWLLLGVLMLGLLARLVDLDLLSATLGLEN